VEAKKKSLLAQRDGVKVLTQAQKDQLDFFQQRGSILLLTTAVARALETFLSRAVANPWRLSFGERVAPVQAQPHWHPIVGVTVSFSGKLLPALKNGLKNTEDISRAGKEVTTLLEATKGPNTPVFEAFARQVQVRA
jgi:hypothetical protein